LNFNYQKATEALNFFAFRAGGRINKMKALKLVYFADRFHLRKYGRPITNDDYFAMKLGPVPSGTRDISLLNADYLDPRELQYAAAVLGSDGFDIVSKKPVDNLHFSDSDNEALEFAWVTFGAMPEFALAELTHAYPEWKKHEQSLAVHSRVHMFFQDFLDDPALDINKCFVLSEDARRDRKNQLEDFAKLAELWN